MYDDHEYALDMLDGEEYCDYAGHEWIEMGGGLMYCPNCDTEEWDDYLEDEAYDETHPEWSGDLSTHFVGPDLI